jgi:hypothetical protein
MKFHYKCSAEQIIKDKQMRQSLAESLAHAHVRSFIEYMTEDGNPLQSVGGVEGAGQYGDYNAAAGEQGQDINYFSSYAGGGMPFTGSDAFDSIYRTTGSRLARLRDLEKRYGSNVSRQAMNRAMRDMGGEMTDAQRSVARAQGYNPDLARSGEADDFQGIRLASDLALRSNQTSTPYQGELSGVDRFVLGMPGQGDPSVRGALQQANANFGYNPNQPSLSPFLRAGGYDSPDVAAAADRAARSTYSRQSRTLQNPGRAGGQQGQQGPYGPTKGNRAGFPGGPPNTDTRRSKGKS